jgi:hypothetical protein
MLHIVHGGVENGDKKWLERAARRSLIEHLTKIEPPRRNPS